LDFFDISVAIANFVTADDYGGFKNSFNHHDLVGKINKPTVILLKWNSLKTKLKTKCMFTVIAVSKWLIPPLREKH